MENSFYIIILPQLGVESKFRKREGKSSTVNMVQVLFHLKCSLHRKVKKTIEKWLKGNKIVVYGWELTGFGDGHSSKFNIIISSYITPVNIDYNLKCVHSNTQVLMTCVLKKNWINNKTIIMAKECTLFRTIH